LTKIRNDHEPGERLTILIPRRESNPNIVRRVVSRGELQHVGAIGEQPASRVRRGIWIFEDLAEDAGIVLADAKPAARGARIRPERRGGGVAPPRGPPCAS
jgi:hypothetical protein